MKGEDWLGKVFRKTFQPNEAIFDEDFTLVGEKVDHYRLLQFRIKTDEMLDFIYIFCVCRALFIYRSACSDYLLHAYEIAR